MVRICDVYLTSRGDDVVCVQQTFIQHHWRAGFFALQPLDYLKTDVRFAYLRQGRLSSDPIGFWLKFVKVVHSPLRMGSRLENEPLVVLKTLQPVADIGRMLGTGFQR